MWLFAARARSISSYSNMIGVTRAGRSTADPPFELARVDVGLEQPECPRDLALVLRAQQRPDGLDGRRGLVGELRNLEHRERRALEQPPDVLAELVPAGEDDAGDGGDRRRDRRGERGDEDVRAVAGNDHERAVDEVVDEVLDAHRPDPDVAHLALQGVRRPGQRGGSERVRHLGDGGVGEVGILGDQVDGLGAVLRTRAARDLVHVVGGDPVDEHAEDLAALVVERVAGDADRRGRVRRRAGLDDDEDRRAELVREVGVQPEVERGRGPGEVGALADDEVAVALERLVRLDDPVPELFVVARWHSPRPARARASRRACAPSW